MARGDESTASSEAQTSERTSRSRRTSTQQDTRQVVTTQATPAQPQIREHGEQETTQLTSSRGSKVTVPSRIADQLKASGRYS